MVIASGIATIDRPWGIPESFAPLAES